MRHALERTRRRVRDLEAEVARLEAELASLRAAFATTVPPAGYEHYSAQFIKGIQSTVQTQADRAGQTQDEVFAIRAHLRAHIRDRLAAAAKKDPA